MRAAAAALLALALACETRTSPWKLSQPLEDASLEREIFRALDAASETGTYPPLSKFQVRAATVIDGQVVVGGNTEYQVPEAIHGESSLVNHAISLFGPEATREKVRFIA
jgi:cytidine deaminase